MDRTFDAVRIVFYPNDYTHLKIYHLDRAFDAVSLPVQKTPFFDRFWRFSGNLYIFICKDFRAFLLGRVGQQIEKSFIVFRKSIHLFFAFCKVLLYGKMALDGSPRLKIYTFYF